MKLIRVLVANQPRLMRELVLATMSDQPDIEVVGQVDQDAAVLAAVESTAPDFLIVALDSSDQLPKPFVEMLVTHPRLKILGIAPNRDATICYWLSMEIRSNRVESSEEGMLGAVRGGAQLV
jgi:DNA-binding NarL/FixJ family response regulator